MERNTNKFQPVMMVEEYWRNCHFSVARFYGGLMIGSKDYKIVNENGITLDELSDPDSKHYVGEGRMAIEPGKPADLIQADWITVYKKMGRDKFIKMLQDLPGITLEQAKARIKIHTNTNQKRNNYEREH